MVKSHFADLEIIEKSEPSSDKMGIVQLHRFIIGKEQGVGLQTTSMLVFSGKEHNFFLHCLFAFIAVSIIRSLR